MEREEIDLAKIKAELNVTRGLISAGRDRIRLVRPFTKEQLGLAAVWADANGRLWSERDGALVRVGWSDACENPGVDE